ncbi:hypothetical protein APTSU1_000530800 [Apodemus speciosus]|uniref:Uncharacterized protein n=1 Tax=Apodemus speciosus TaxID=105296 RepID=A0ABQ0ET50_APOSI
MRRILSAEDRDCTEERLLLQCTGAVPWGLCHTSKEGFSV